MRTEQTSPKTINDYISGFPPEIQVILEKIRMVVRETAPDAHETIKYGMPTFSLNGNLVYFAAFKKHIGFYPAPTGVEEFDHALSGYKTGKGSVQFPYDRPIPYDLIQRIVSFRLKENLNKGAQASH